MNLRGHLGACLSFVVKSIARMRIRKRKEMTNECSNLTNEMNSNEKTDAEKMARAITVTSSTFFLERVMRLIMGFKYRVLAVRQLPALVSLW